MYCYSKLLFYLSVKMERVKTHKLRSGVYELRSKADPEIYYIGSAIDMRIGLSNHISKLRLGRSNHYKLVDHVKKYGIEDLEFIIIERCSQDNLYEREQYYISELNPPLNTNKFASCCDGDSGRQKAFMDFLDEDIPNYVLLEYKINKICDKDLFPEELIPFNI